MPNGNLIVGDDGSNTIQGTSGRDVIYGFDPDGPESQVTSIAATRVAHVTDLPLFVVSPPGDTHRLFIVEKGGEIQILNLDTHQLETTPFLDVSSEVDPTGEQGLLGLAFDPNFANNGLFYVNMSNLSGNSEIRSYHVSASDPDHADPASMTHILTVDQPAGLSNHKGGWLAFGPDGDLYASFGDGGGGGDQLNNAQNMDVLLGKILRLDVHGDDFPDDATRNYAIPADNPFVGVAGADEIWALGLRNPFRPSFDRATGELYIADVGQEHVEEVDIGQVGANYGWNVYEGPSVYSVNPLSGGTLTFPIYSYEHPDPMIGNAITGGYVYRGTSEGLQGQYFFADLVYGTISTLHFENGAWVATDRTSEITTDVGAINNPTSFGEDAHGNLYLTDLDGDIFLLTPIVTSADQGDHLFGNAGDDMIYGGSGADVLDGGPGSDYLDGGPGSDTVSCATSTQGVIIDLSAQATSDGVSGDMLVSIENATGSAFDDTIYGSQGDNVLDGGAGGTDHLYGFGGNDTVSYASSQLAVIIDLSAQATSDGVSGDVLGSIENAIGSAFDDTIYGSQGDNVLDGGPGGTDHLFGFGGNDTVSYGTSLHGVIIDLSVQVTSDGVSADVLESIENAIGSAFDDTVYGSQGDNVIDGGAGGADQLFGFGGNDTVSYASSLRGVTIDLAAQSTFDGVSTDTLQSIENAIGSDFDDVLVSASGANLLDGGAGNDTVSYAASSTGVVIDLAAQAASDGDTLQSIENAIGSALNDTVYGSPGANVIDGGSGGTDLLYGFGGADRFQFSAPGSGPGLVTIGDFQPGIDHIGLLGSAFGLASGASLTADHDFVASASPAAADPTPTILYNTTTGVLSWDGDGTGSAAAHQFAVVAGAPSLLVADFQII